MVSEQEIENFYENNVPQLLPNSKFRHFRLATKNGFMKVNKTIKNGEALQKVCVKIKPLAVYQTISYWLNPKTLGKRSKYPVFLGASFVVDFDEEHKAEDNVQKAIRFFQEKGMKDIVRVRTGRGWHLHILDWAEYQNINEQNSVKREQQYLSKMHKTVREMRIEGILFDERVSQDTRRLVRVPNTLHQNGNKITLTSLKGEDLLTPSSLMTYTLTRDFDR